MSADDQQFLDLLSSIPTHLRRYSGEVADYVDKAVDDAASHVREALASSSWLPDHMRPQAPPPPPPAVEILHLSTLERMQDWIVRHRILSGVFVVAVTYVTYRTVRRGKLLRKPRRAKRARNGGRLEVVVIAGSPTLPLTKALALDMERKGFIVFIVCNSIEDDMIVQNLSRPDIKALGIDITDPPSAGSSIERFAAYLQTPHAAVPKAKPNYLTLKSVILIPSLNYQTSPIATIPPSSFADLFNTHLLHPILTIQAFLPLLTSRLTPPPQPHSQPSPAPPAQQPPQQQPQQQPQQKQPKEQKDQKEQQQQHPQNQHHPHTHHAHPHHAHAHNTHEEDLPSTPKVLVFTPSIISSINPPFHAPEATICSALSAFTEVLTAELRPLAIPVTHVQLGTFDFGPFTSHPALAHGGGGGGGRNGPTIATSIGGGHPGLLGHTATAATHPLQWPEAARHAYARNFAAQSASAISAGRVRGLRGSSLRDLHNAVFDVLDGSEKRAVVRVGLGADLYGFVGRWFPRGLVAWMMGIRRVGELSAWNGPAGKGGGGSSGSDAGSFHSSDSGGENDLMREGSEFIAVVREDDAGANVWKD